jgi:soluble lytic murein transglycosylase-like protein
MYEISERVNSKLAAYDMSISFGTVLQTAQSAQGTYEASTAAADASGVINLDYTGDYSGSKASTFTSKYDSIISDKARQYGIDENIIKAVIQAESDFNPTCTSSAGAKGLMQLMPCNVSDLGITDVYDPVQNIDGGVRELKGYLDSFGGDLKIALAAYNCGPSRVRRLGITNLDDSQQFASLPKETRNYITKIMGNLQNI